MSANQFPLFCLFPECKIQTAIILLYFNTNAKLLKKICARSKAAIDYLKTMLTIKKKYNHGGLLGQYLALAEEHTLITHAVCFHLDSFSRNISGDIIKNKVCLNYTQRAIRTVI